ncbi:hypothetical protein EKA58_25225, partial [Salmonella enterica subsp. enterica serovar Panama]|nr:hypothetical protein [Salmonella enterica subsp. enterica serovar Panama]
TSGKLLSKEARAGTTTIAIGKAVKQTVDTRFYPQVNVCLTNLDSSGFVTPGTTEVHICDGSGHTIPSGSGYKVAAPALSASGCPADGGGVCPSDTAGVKADFKDLSGDDIKTLANTVIKFNIHDEYAGQNMAATFTNGEIAFYGELKAHKPNTNLGETTDVFHTQEAQAFCNAVVRQVPTYDDKQTVSNDASAAIQTGASTGGVTHGSEMATLYMGRITDAITTGGDTNPEIFVDGLTNGVTRGNYEWTVTEERYRADETDQKTLMGAIYPSSLVFVNGKRAASASWAMNKDGVTMVTGYHVLMESSFGLLLHNATGWNLSDAYYVNNWPGTPYTLHKGNGDSAYHYVTQVNYITGYICAASLH